MQIPAIASRRAGRLGGTLVVMMMLAALLPAVASAATPPTITSATTTPFTIGVAGTFTVTTAGVPTPSIVRTGSALPTGVTFVDHGNGTGTLSGTPAAATSGSYPMTFTAANGNAPDAVQSFTLVVSAGTAPAITSTASTNFTVGVPGAFTVTATGIPTPTIGESGSLPSGIAYTDNGNGTGTLSGTPAAAVNGSYPLTFTASNGNVPSAVQSFTLFVTSGSAPTITSAATATFTVGVSGTFAVTATGSPVPSIVRTGSALPTGMTFDDNGTGTGTLSGTPAAATNGSYALTFTASNGNLPNAVQGFTLVVSTGTAPAITSAATTTFTIGVAGTFTVTATGSPVPSIVRSGSALPSGVTFVDHGNGTGTLAGTPAAGTNGSYAVTFTAANGNPPPAVQTFTLVVGAPGPTVTINQAAGQGDPTATSPINFTVVFSAAVTGFVTGDLTIGGTAGGTKVATVTGSGTTYTIAVTGMTTAGTVVATVPAGVAIDVTGAQNAASTSTDNTVSWATAGASITLTTSAPMPPGARDPVITWGQGFHLGVRFAANGASRTVQIQAMRDGITWNTITSLTMDASGAASYYYTPVTNLWYRAVFAGAPDLAGATSNQVRTVVRQIALLRPTSNGAITSVARGTTVTFTTTVRPSRPELAPPTVTYWVYVNAGGSWHQYSTRSVSVGTSGLATFTWTFSSSGLWYVRSMANPTPYNANSVMSPTEQYRVS